jgi:hypothetical protein
MTRTRTGLWFGALSKSLRTSQGKKYDTASTTKAKENEKGIVLITRKRF